MKADVLGALIQLDTSWKCFEHKGKSMTKEQVKNILVYAIKMGYKHTDELSDLEVDGIINNIKK